MKKNSDPQKILLATGLILLVCMIFTAGYFTLRTTFTRFSLDYLYPYLKTANILKNSAETAALAANKSKLELAALALQLTRENAKLAAMNESANSLAIDNENLRTLLKITPQSGFKPTYAEITARDPVKWFETFTIDAGTKDSVNAGDCILAPYIDENGENALAMIGRVTAAAKNSSIVSTLYHSECTSGVLLENANTYGILACGRTSQRKTVTVTYLSPESAYSTGDKVITSGASRNTPFGLMLGRTVPTKEGYSARIASSKLYAEAEFIPAVKIDDVRFVVVLSPMKTAED